MSPQGPQVEIEVEALVTDRYLDALLAATDRRAVDAPADPALDPGVRRAARRMRDELIRLHPSFRFEERLAARLAAMGSGMGLPAAAGAEGSPIPIPLGVTPAGLGVDPSDSPGDPLLPAGADDARSASAAPMPTAGPPVPRPLIIGGLTSAALSIAGAAYVAWRSRGHRPVGSPMVRAVRAARQARLGAAAGGLASRARARLD